MLLGLVGPLAPTLLRKIAASANSYQEVIDNLTQHLAGEQKTEFEEKSRLILRQTTNKSQSQPKNSPQTSTPTISDSFVRKCEQELVNLIGPMGSFLVQKAIKSSPNITPLELVNLLSAQIPDSKKSLEFQQRLFC